MLPIIYTQPNCGPCQVLKKWLQSNNIIYLEKGAKEAVEAGYRSTPVLEYKGQVLYRDWETDRKSTRLNSSHSAKSRMPSSA